MLPCPRVSLCCVIHPRPPALSLPFCTQALNQAISDMQTFSGGGPNKQSSDHSHTVVDSLRSRLKDATAGTAARKILLRTAGGRCLQR